MLFFARHCFIALIVLLIIQPVFACEIQDDTGKTIQLSHSAQRIVSLAPDLTEILFAIGAGKQIVGVDSSSDYPNAVAQIPKVASYNSIDAEKIVSLHPDLIVAWADASYVPALRKLGIPLYLSHQKKITDIAQTMKRLGCLAGVEKQANLTANHYMQRYQQLRMQYATSKKIKVFYQVWSKPLMTITKNSWINEVITICGGQNIFADLLGAAPEVDVEAVIAASPDIILGTKSVGLLEQQWQTWQNIPAVKNHHIDSVNADSIERAGPRLLDGVEQVCKVLSF